MQDKKLSPMSLNSFVTYECESYPLLFGDFLLGEQEKVTRPREGTELLTGVSKSTREEEAA
jgi:hypothetical protein